MNETSFAEIEALSLMGYASRITEFENAKIKYGEDTVYQEDDSKMCPIFVQLCDIIVSDIVQEQNEYGYEESKLDSKAVQHAFRALEPVRKEFSALNPSEITPNIEETMFAINTCYYTVIHIFFGDNEKDFRHFMFEKQI